MSKYICLYKKILYFSKYRIQSVNKLVFTTRKTKCSVKFRSSLFKGLRVFEGSALKVFYVCKCVFEGDWGNFSQVKKVPPNPFKNTLASVKDLEGAVYAFAPVGAGRTSTGRSAPLNLPQAFEKA